MRGYVHPHSVTHNFDSDKSSLHAILGMLSPLDLVYLSRVSVADYLLISAYWAEVFSVQRALLPFFSSPERVEGFRRLMLQTEALISGSLAIQIFDRAHWSDSDLDIYVEHRRAFPMLCWLRFIADYDEPTRRGTKMSHPSRTDTFILPYGPSRAYFYADSKAIVQVLDFYVGERKIQLITTTREPLEAILSFTLSKSSCQSQPEGIFTTIFRLASSMNLITHNTAYALYPYATFEKHQAALTNSGRQLPYGAEEFIAKYRRRGWEIVNVEDGVEVDDPKSELFWEPMAVTHRSVGDSMCWSMPW